MKICRQNYDKTHKFMTKLHKITQKSSNFNAKYNQNYSKYTNFTQKYDKIPHFLLQNGPKLYKNSLKSVYFV